MKKFPLSTTGVYLPGVGKTITQANIAAYQAARGKEGQEPATYKEIAIAFVGVGSVKPRHLARSYRLMHKGA